MSRSRDGAPPRDAGRARRARTAVLIGSVLASVVLLAGCNARTPAASTGSPAEPSAGSTADAPAASADSSDAADPLADIESTVDAIERDLDADAG